MPRRARPPTCRGTRKDGSRRSATTIDADGYCFAHSPTRAAERDAARIKGGRNSSSLVRVSKLVPARLGPIFARLETVIEQTHAGELDPKVANAIANCARAAAAVLASGEMQQRVRDLEQKMEGGA